MPGLGIGDFAWVGILEANEAVDLNCFRGERWTRVSRRGGTHRPKALYRGNGVRDEGRPPARLFSVMFIMRRFIPFAPAQRTAALQIAALLTAWVPTPANAQDEPPQRGAGSVVSFSTRDDIAVTLSGYIQADGRWLSGATQRLPDGFVLRRARFIVDAAMPSGWHLRLQPDFGQGRVLVQDAFVGFERGGLLARAGRFRPNYGLERMQSSSTLLFPERSLINSLMPSRSFGTQMRYTRGAWTLATGGFRTPIGTDAAAIDTDGDVEATIGSGHDLLLRAAWAWRDEARYADVQAAVLDGRERGSLESPAMTRGAHGRAATDCGVPQRQWPLRTAYRRTRRGHWLGPELAHAALGGVRHHGGGRTAPRA